MKYDKLTVTEVHFWDRAIDIPKLLGDELKGLEYELTSVPDHSHVLRFTANTGIPTVLMFAMPNLYDLIERGRAEFVLHVEDGEARGAHVGYRTFKIDSGALTTCTTLGEYCRAIRKQWLHSPGSTQVPAPLIALVRTQLTKKLLDFRNAIPRKSLQKRQALCSFLIDVDKLVGYLPIEFRDSDLVLMEVNEILKSCWTIPAVKEMRTEFFNEYYFTEGVSFYPKHIHEVPYCITLSNRVMGNWNKDLP